MTRLTREDAVHDMAKENAEIAKRVLDYTKLVEEGHQERDRADRDEKAKLIALVERLAQANGTPEG